MFIDRSECECFWGMQKIAQKVIREIALRRNVTNMKSDVDREPVSTNNGSSGTTEYTLTLSSSLPSQMLNFSNRHHRLAVVVVVVMIVTRALTWGGSRPQYMARLTWGPDYFVFIKGLSHFGSENNNLKVNAITN